MPEIHLVEHASRAAQALAAHVEELLSNGADRLIVDISGAGIDAPLLRLLVVTDRLLGARGGDLVVLCDNGDAQLALQSSGLDLHLSVVNTLTDAVDLLDPLPGSATATTEARNSEGLPAE